MDYIIKVCTDINQLDDIVLGKIVILRWGFNQDKLDAWKNHMRNNTACFHHLLIYAQANDEVIGYAFFCENEVNAEQWYYGDLIVSDNFRRNGIASDMIVKGIESLTCINVKELFTYVDYDNEISKYMHEKLGFTISDKHEMINGFLNDNQFVYKYAV